MLTSQCCKYDSKYCFISNHTYVKGLFLSDWCISQCPRCPQNKYYQVVFCHLRPGSPGVEKGVSWNFTGCSED